MAFIWEKHNVGLVTLRMKQLVESEAKKEVLKRMRRIAQSIVDYVDSHFDDNSEQFPQYTGNLHDATGVAIYNDGTLESYMPTRRATSAQMSPIGEDEWGSEELANVIRQGVLKYSQGLWLVLFSASSYAFEVHNIGSPADPPRGKAFFNELWDALSIDIKREFENCYVAPLLGLSDSIPF